MIRTVFEYVFVIGSMTLLLLALMVIAGGCLSSSGGHSASPTVPDLPLSLPTIPSWNVLPSLLVVGFVLSVVAVGLGFGKLGGITAIACVSGLLLQHAVSVPWLAQATALILLAGTLLVIAGILMKNGAIKDMIMGVQKLKEETLMGPEGKKQVDDLALPSLGPVACPSWTRQQVNEALQSKQSKETQRQVQGIKSKLKKKGKIQ